MSKSPPQPKRGRCHLRWHSFNGLRRCAEPKNHNGPCRAPRTGDRIRWKKLGLYEKDWPKDMKPLNKNLKKPRGSAVDSERDRTRKGASQLAMEADIKLSIISGDLRKIGEVELADTARRLRREINALQTRINAIDVVKKPELED